MVSLYAVDSMNTCTNTHVCSNVYGYIFIAFTFFANKHMQSFYKRFVRDSLRYNDEIQCAGAELVAAVRADSLRTNPADGGDFYALHVRRGDLQFKEVKIGADEMLHNLHWPNGSLIIPPGSLVYLSTDDPDGVCKGCYAEGKPCETFDRSAKLPQGCPADSSWNAFIKAGWKLRFLHNYLDKGKFGLTVIGQVSRI